ncbi:redoxin family protein [Polaribacter sp. AHE13PA]|uniref:redoxin family protein n=1 Tax=Polaribacter sp. AHE13PA TaxID=2745562 RepID=UPI001C4FD8B0|nr:redoxin family protein [Polaribacter sp. AHE13PA]QXP68540.1 redoxin family protein [Polaribacter sp. AHE13PA]
MNKVLFILIMAFCLTSCSKKTKLDYVLLTGKIDNLKDKEITLLKTNRSYTKKIVVTSDGTFKDTMKIKSGFYRLISGKNKVVFYLENGYDLNIKADADNFKSSLNVSGKGAGATKYLAIKGDISSNLRTGETSFFKLKETKFLTTAKKIKTTLHQVLDTMQGVSENFKALENRNINYSYVYQLSNFKKFNKINDEVSQELKKELQKIDFNSEEDYRFSGAYYTLIGDYYTGQVKELVKTDSIDRGLASIKTYSKISNQTIKNELIYIQARMSIAQTESLDVFYETYMSASTDEKNNAKIYEIYHSLKKVSEYKFSPKFIDYENYAGGTSSLDDFKGKYVYIDIWATWCGPCLGQIPYLKKLEKKYHNKNIEFLSISIDQKKNYDKWRTMIEEKELGGVQLLADNNFNSQFIKDYAISGIPRFILLDPQGKIIDANAPRPSDEKLIKLFNELDL